MKPSIQERMERQINLTTKYNQLFDLMVTTSETSFSTQSSNPADNQYSVITEALTVNIICNDNQYNTININIYDNGTDSQIGTLQININGDVDESLHNVPRAVRRTINSYIDDLYEAIDSWIDELENGGNDGGDE